MGDKVPALGQIAKNARPDGLSPVLAGARADGAVKHRLPLDRFYYTCNSLHAERGLAPTTLATILTRLERRGVVAHRTRARQYVYRSLVSEEEAQHSMVSELTERLFAGDVPALVNHLLTAQEVSPGDLARIREMLDSAGSAKETAK